jgi:hypothetical protein
MTCARRTVPLVTTVLALAPMSLLLAQQPAQTPAPQGAPRAQTPAPGQQPAPAARSESRAVAQGFSVVLVLADLAASSAPDDVPPAARRALADMKDFLPYKSYRLLDAAWILGQGSSGTVTRLRGSDEQEYELRMSTSPVYARGQEGSSSRAVTSTVGVRFTLSESVASEAAHVEAVLAEEARRSAETSRAAQERSNEIPKLEAELRAAEQQKNEAKARELRQALAQARQRREELARERTRSERSAQSVRPSSKRFGGTVIDTSFNMDIGETVVVGTSRLKGNSRALIALLTAVPVKGSRLPTEAR